MGLIWAEKLCNVPGIAMGRQESALPRLFPLRQTWIQNTKYKIQTRIQKPKKSFSAYLRGFQACLPFCTPCTDKGVNILLYFQLSLSKQRLFVHITSQSGWIESNFDRHADHSLMIPAKPADTSPLSQVTFSHILENCNLLSAHKGPCCDWEVCAPLRISFDIEMNLKTLWSSSSRWPLGCRWRWRSWGHGRRWLEIDWCYPWHKCQAHASQSPNQFWDCSWVYNKSHT